MKKFVISSVLALGLVFTANANTAVVTTASAEAGCASWAGEVVDALGIDVGTSHGLSVYYALVRYCENYR